MPSIIGSSSHIPQPPFFTFFSPCEKEIARLKKAMRSLSALQLRNWFVKALGVYPKTIDGLLLIFEDMYLSLEYLATLEEWYEHERVALSKKKYLTQEEQTQVKKLNESIDNVGRYIVINIKQIENQLLQFLKDYMVYAERCLDDIYDIFLELYSKKKDLNNSLEMLNSEEKYPLRQKIIDLKFPLSLEIVDKIGEEAQLTYLPGQSTPTNSSPFPENGIKV